MLRIYEKDLTAASLATSLATNGLGTLPEALSCTRHQVINGDWSLTLSYPLDAPGTALLQPERLLCYEDEGGAQLYRISRLTPSISRQGRTLEVEAPHLCYDLAHKYIVNIETKEDSRYPDGINAATALKQLLEGTGFAPGEVTVDSGTLDYLDVLQKDTMSAIKEQLLDKWGGELEFDNFTVHLRSALGQDRRYPIRDGRNIDGITVTEDYETVVTRLHVRGYESANFESINGGKDWIDSELMGSYSYPREGYADFTDVDDPQELMRLGKARLAELEVPSITYDIRLAQMRGTVQYAAYRRLENFALGDTAVLHSAAVDRDVILRCSELETDCLTGRNKALKLGNTDIKLLESITAGASANDRLAHVLDAEGNVQAEKIAGKLNLVRVANLTAEMARIATAAIGKATIEAAQIQHLEAQVAKITTAVIETGKIDWAQIKELQASMAKIAQAQIGEAEIDWAKIKGLAAGTALLEKTEAGKLHAADLAVTDANIVNLNADKISAGTLSVERLVIVGTDKSIVYEVNRQNGTEQLSQTTIDGGAITQKTITADQIIAQGITADCLNVDEIFSNEALIGKVTSRNIDVAELFASSATAGVIHTSNIAADVGKELNLSSNQSITGIVSQEVKDAIGFRVEVVATSNVLSSEIPSTVLTARVWGGKQEVTETLPADRFAWVRVTSDKVADEMWNAAHKGVKQVTLTTRDVASSATYRCNITDGK